MSLLGASYVTKMTAVHLVDELLQKHVLDSHGQLMSNCCASSCLNGMGSIILCAGGYEQECSLLKTELGQIFNI